MKSKFEVVFIEMRYQSVLASLDSDGTLPVPRVGEIVTIGSGRPHRVSYVKWHVVPDSLTANVYLDLLF